MYAIYIFMKGLVSDSRPIEIFRGGGEAYAYVEVDIIEMRVIHDFGKFAIPNRRSNDEWEPQSDLIQHHSKRTQIRCARYPLFL